ncbi:hypothetical protein [Cytophaga hutchinsonii]|uniref:EF-hand domain-containing protein n=1 Tax=Cytophaga hutchinsonii (strain ATCC 33406 / DSM 1761 / CIP 103989 / NBRC 15051 / NCIMB 9469 / D465) TaxID=269798 RepID=A0A6N4SUM8_CYTH3|nr:hypothetical protein [Cytophaga hutchinsonii]ABG60094.1 conserved hypothetical protein [Cytophaga hutchinsonii ATCC 33406]SFX24293.1 hypothetical protein SAMN04487930_102209 [Cytophaga hutchinsonii ATCC 33406]
MTKHTFFLFCVFIAFSCSNDKLESKGFAISEISDEETVPEKSGLAKDSAVFQTQPYKVLLTAHPAHRLTPLFKVNYNKKTQKPFIGSTDFHYRYSEEIESGNNWNSHLIPGFEAAYGYNLVNISHFNTGTQKQQVLFEKPVLIKTIYYPAFTKDTLNNKPVTRNFYMVSAYDEDTNKDGMINLQDLRRFYYFDLEGENKRALLPENYSIQASEYDPANDVVYIFAKLDENNNGTADDRESVHIFWIDLTNPEKTGRQL